MTQKLSLCCLENILTFDDLNDLSNRVRGNVYLCLHMNHMVDPKLNHINALDKLFAISAKDEYDLHLQLASVKELRHNLYFAILRDGVVNTIDETANNSMLSNSADIPTLLSNVYGRHRVIEGVKRLIIQGDLQIRMLSDKILRPTS